MLGPFEWAVGLVYAWLRGCSQHSLAILVVSTNESKFCVLTLKRPSWIFTSQREFAIVIPQFSSGTMAEREKLLARTTNSSF
jgi:hypothetical protein